MREKELVNHIRDLKKILKDKVIIPVHHYQPPEIVAFADFIGDSYKLAVESSKTIADFIVFCGVLFMAEGASILANEKQKVLIPEPQAGCPLAEMADISLVESAFKMIKYDISGDIVPVVYMNSYADLKSFCGSNGGSVCTSSNAEEIVEHYFKKGKRVLFFPDYYLGRNTAKKMNLKESEIVKIKKNLTLETEGNAADAKIFLWDGYCPVHQRFTVGDIEFLREEYPDIKIIVHPECKEDVVDSADLSGSTERIFRLIKEASSGSVWGVGTETTFVDRIALENKDKVIVPLRKSVCKNMKKITLPKLVESLESVISYLDGKGKLINEINVNEKYKSGAKKALEKMIDIVEKNK